LKVFSVSSRFHAGVTAADKVESAILERMGFLAGTPGAGDHRKDLTSENVEFFLLFDRLQTRNKATTNRSDPSRFRKKVVEQVGIDFSYPKRVVVNFRIWFVENTEDKLVGQ
jgi:hypothetical protein